MMPTWLLAGSLGSTASSPATWLVVPITVLGALLSTSSMMKRASDSSDTICATIASAVSAGAPSDVAASAAGASVAAASVAGTGLATSAVAWATAVELEDPIGIASIGALALSGALNTYAAAPASSATTTIPATMIVL